MLMVRVAIVLVLFVLSSPAAHAKRVAIVVGINKYDNLPGNQQLAKAVNDARSVEVALKSLGFDVSKAEDVDRSAFNQVWQQFLNRVGPGDEVAMYFSGHGVEIEGVNYLVPRNVPAVGSGEMRRLKNEALSFDEIRRDLAAQGPRLSLFILDACRDNPFTDARGRSIGGAKGLVPVQAEEGTFIMFAAGAREMALDRLSDSDSDPNSVYTRKLLPLLQRPGLRLPDMAQKVRAEVRQLASTVGHRQSPAYYDEGADDICLAGCATPLDAREAAREWARVDKTSVAELETFVHRHGASPEADYGRARLGELKKQGQADGLRQATKTNSNEAAPARTDVEAQRLAMQQRQVGEVAMANTTAAGSVFRDCPDCPEMVVVPAGSFMMGSNNDDASEKPVHKVTIAKPFAVGKFDVTFAEWDACVLAGGCTHKPEDQGWGRGTRPVINVFWDDATKYVTWLSRKTGKSYRLPSEAEWEYAARGVTSASVVHTTYYWGNDIGKSLANCNGCGSQWDGKQAAPVGSFTANAFGLYDMHGNVWQWIEDCWHGSYQGAPTDGSAWITSCADGGRHVVRGGSWVNGPHDLRASARFRFPAIFRIGSFGFRLARML
jgi:formylglycine-generating enzyme required for sulfatase activity